jgi:hypothetical protein
MHPLVLISVHMENVGGFHAKNSHLLEAGL